MAVARWYISHCQSAPTAADAAVAIATESLSGGVLNSGTCDLSGRPLAPRGQTGVCRIFLPPSGGIAIRRVCWLGGIVVRASDL